MDVNMPEATLPLTQNVDPAIFQFLQDKIDEEGKIRDVRRIPCNSAHAVLTSAAGIERDPSDS